MLTYFLLFWGGLIRKTNKNISFNYQSVLAYNACAYGKVCDRFSQVRTFLCLCVFKYEFSWSVPIQYSLFLTSSSVLQFNTVIKLIVLGICFMVTVGDCLDKTVG